MAGSDEAAPSGWSSNTMTPAQSRAARGLLGWSVADLAARVGADDSQIDDFEQSVAEVASGRIEAYRSALMAAGIVFSDGDSGVRLKTGGGDEGTRLGDLNTENDR